MTVINKHDVKDQFMGQAVLTLQHKRVWCRGGTFFLPLSPLEVEYLFLLLIVIVFRSTEWNASAIRYIDSHSHWCC